MAQTRTTEGGAVRARHAETSEGYERRWEEERAQLCEAAVNSMQVGLNVWRLEDPDDLGSFRLVVSNPAAGQATGVAREEVLGKTMAECYPASLKTELPGLFAEVIRSGTAADLGEVRYGDERIPEGVFSVKAFPLPNRCVGVAFENITDRKQAEEEVRRLELERAIILDSMSELVLYHDLDMKVLWANKAAADSLGLTSQQLAGCRCYEMWYQLSEPCAGCPVVKARQTGQPEKGEIATPDGRVWVSRANPVRGETGNIVGIVEVVSDITGRKRAEEALEESEARFRRLAEAALEGIIIHEGSKVLDVNEAFAVMFGYQRSELIGMDRTALVPPEWLARVLQKIDSGSEGPYEAMGLKKDGTAFPVEVCGKAVPYGSRVVRVAAVRDLTERKRAEEALRESEAHYRLLAENVTDVIWTADLNLNLTYISPSMQQVSGFTVEECMAQAPLGTLTPESLEGVRGIHADALAIELGQRPLTGPRTVEAEARRKDGSTAWIEARVSFLRDSDGTPMGILGVSRDITERKRAEEALRESERHYRLLAENATDVIWTADMDLNLTYVSPSAEWLWGYSVEERMGMGLEDILTPASLEVARRTYAEAMAAEAANENASSRPLTLELEVRRKDGSTAWVETSASFLREPEGRPAGLLGVSRDITERKRAEEALRESERRYRLLAENVSDVIWTADLNLNLTYISPSIQQVSGFTVEECMAQARLGTLTPESLEGVKRVHADTLAIELGQRPLAGSRAVEAEARRKDGSIAWIEAKVSFLRDPDGRPVGILGVSRDITERKQAEDALRRRTHDLGERLKELQCLYGLSSLVQKRGISVDEIAPGAVALLPPAWQYPETACARIVLEGREVTTENFRGTRWRQSCDILVHGERSGIVEVCYLDERPRSDEGPFLKEERDLIDAVAEILGRVVEAKQAEEALRASEANYRAIFNSASDAIVVYDAETARMVDVNPRFCEIFGYTPEEVRQLRLEDLGSGEPPYTEEEAVQWVKEAAELEIGPFEFRAKDKAGGPVWVEGSLRLVVIEGREYLLGIGHDITERKRAEEALQETREELESRVERGMRRGNPYGLSFRELTVLHLVAAGKADKEIAFELGISPQTASKHLANILSKMGAASRTEAGVRALREGLLE